MRGKRMRKETRRRDVYSHTILNQMNFVVKEINLRVLILFF